jgi:hypothetical protein
VELQRDWARREADGIRLGSDDSGPTAGSCRASADETEKDADGEPGVEFTLDLAIDGR